MSKALSTIGKIAGVVATVAMFIPGAQPIAAVAAGISAAATIGSQALYKPPPARGSVTNVLIAPDAPSPYVMGEGYYGGVMRHDVAYGATLKKVPNPYRWIVSVYSVGGPVQSISPRVELAATTSYYSGFLYTDTQLGLCPEASGLAPQFSGAPGWNTTTARLSGQAAIGWNLKFDRDGKVFSTGVPRLGAYGQWVKVYDPRKDSTFPGGSGSHRLGVESTYEWSQNPALHAGTYSFGRWQNGKRVFGIGMPGDGIDFVGIAAWANVCDANSWTIFGVAYEPSNRWENLNDICAAGGGRPVFANGKLSWLWSAPKVPLDTITDADIADDNYSVTAMTSWRDRLNSVVPKYRSPEHDWEMVPQAAAVSIPDYVTEDGELKQVEWPFNFVKSANQAAVLAAYKLLDSRELQPITLPCLPRLRKYRPGECLHIELPELGLDTDAIILTREFDPARMIVTFTFMGETPGKHDFALGRTGTPPPTPALKQTVEERDLLRWSAMLDQGARTVEYDPDTVYSEGMTARMPDGSTWEYINAAPSSGNPPPDWPTTTNGYWSNLTPPIEFQAPTDISPTPPLELPEGTLWIAPDGHPYRFGTRPWIGSDGEAWIGADGSPWLGGGYADVQDQVGVTAKDIADAVTAQVARIADDGWLTAGEKSGLVLSHKAMIENYVALNAKAIAIGEAATERANATAAVNALNAYLVSLSPAWNDTTQDTAADADTITSLWGDAAQKVALLQAAIQGLPGPAGADGAPGTPGAPGTDGVDGIDGEDGKLIEFVWKRAPTEPSAPTGNGIPSGWSDEPPEGADPLWMSKAKQELDGTLVSGETWSDPIRHDGPKGADGLSVAELTIYRRSGSAPATPAGGSYDFGTGVLTPPSGWSVTIPAGADPVYAASGVASKQGVTGSAAPNWMGVGKAFQDGADGANGTNGADGSATNVIFRRSASQPSTPSASAGVPSGWYDSTGSVPAGADPIWASFGTRPTSTDNYTWQVAKRVEGQDGVSPLIATASSSIQIDTDAGGVPKAGQMPRVLVYDVRYAGGDVKSVATIGNLSSAGCTASIVGKNVEISALSATSGHVTVDWSYVGQTVSVRVDFMTKADGADGAAGRSTRIITKVSSTSYMALANTVALNASDTGKISARGSLDYAVNPGTPARSCILQIKAQYREAGGTWIDIAGTETTGSNSFYNVFDNLVEPGSVACPHTVVSALTANAAYEVRLLGRRSAGTDYPASQTGSLYAGSPT